MYLKISSSLLEIHIWPTSGYFLEVEAILYQSWIVQQSIKAYSLDWGPTQPRTQGCKGQSQITEFQKIFKISLFRLTNLFFCTFIIVLFPNLATLILMTLLALHQLSVEKVGCILYDAL